MRTNIHAPVGDSFDPRTRPTDLDPNEAMRDVLGQYAKLIETRRAKVQEQSSTKAEPDMRTGWLLWQESLRQFLYFEEEMLPPILVIYTAELCRYLHPAV